MADRTSRQGSSYATPEILEHLAALHAPPDPALEAAFRAPDLHGVPAIQLGVHEGALLGWLLRGIAASRVVEIGASKPVSPVWRRCTKFASESEMVVRVVPAAGAVMLSNVEL